MDSLRSLSITIKMITNPILDTNIVASMGKLAVADMGNSGMQFRAGRILKMMQTELQTFEVIRKPLLEKYADRVETTDDKGIKKQGWEIRIATKDEYEAELDPMLNEKIVIEFYPLDLSELNHGLKGYELAVLEPFFSDNYIQKLLNSEK
jgi:hypothetical protein